MAWKFAPEQDKFAPSVACCDVVNRGLSYADGKILATTLDTHVYALDAKTGQVIWKVQNGDPEQGQTMTMAPLVVHDKVIVGISGGEFGVRGFLTAYDLTTGKMAWRAYSVGSDEDIKFDGAKTIDGATQAPVGKDSSVKTWQGDEWKLGGGTTWGWYSYDPTLNLVYYGTGNPGTWNPTQRPGDNKWSTTLIARNPDTGVAAWAYQMTLTMPGITTALMRASLRIVPLMAKPSRLLLILIATVLPTCSTGGMGSCCGPTNLIPPPTGPRRLI